LVANEKRAVSQVLGSAIVYSSGTLGYLTRYAAQQTVTFPQLGLGAIVFGVAWVESFTNELLHDVRWSGAAAPYPEVVRLRAVAKAADIESTSTNLGTKIRTIGTCLTGSLPDEGRQPFQDFDLLVKLRNQIIHQRPERIDTATELTDEGNKRLIRKPGSGDRRINAQIDNLISRGLCPPRDTMGLDPLSQLFQSQQVAVWAFDTASATVIEVCEWLPEEFRKRATAGLAAQRARELQSE
jgi:hypothetical protein